MTGDPNTLNPLLTTLLIEGWIGTLMFDPLVETDFHGNIKPILAVAVPTQQNGGVSADGKTIVYKLRRNVKWQDGSPLTSADVAFTYRAYMNPHNKIASIAPHGEIQSLETPDASTVVVHLKRPFSPFIAQAFSAILPAHLLAGLPDLNTAAYNAKPVGTGPFVLDRWTRGSEIDLRANPTYFRGRPHFDRVVLKIVPDLSSAGVALRTGEVDWIPFSEPSANARAIAAMPGFSSYAWRINGYMGLGLNSARPPLDDRRVREALAFAIDRHAIVARVLNGSYPEATADIPSWLWGYDPSLKPIPYDPARSRALLADAGWRAGPAGVLTKNGKLLSLTLLIYSGSQQAAAVGLDAQSMLKAVGVELTLKFLPLNVLFSPTGPVIGTADYDLYYGGLTKADDPDDYIGFGCRAFPPRGFNVSRWCNQTFEHAAMDALVHYDRTVRQRDYAITQRALLDDVPLIFLYWNANYMLYATKLNFVDAHGGLEDPYEWSLRR